MDQRYSGNAESVSDEPLSWRSTSASSSSRVRQTQNKSIVDRILNGSQRDHNPSDLDVDIEPSLPDLLPFSTHSSIIPTVDDKRAERRRTSQERSSKRRTTSSSVRKDSVIDRYLQKSETSTIAIDLPALEYAREAPSRRRRASLRHQQFNEPPTGTLVDIDCAPVKQERKRRPSGATRLLNESIKQIDNFTTSNETSERRRRASGTTLRRQDSMTNLHRIQNEISAFQDITVDSSTSYTNGRSATYEAMATAMLSEPPPR